MHLTLKKVSARVLDLEKQDIRLKAEKKSFNMDHAELMTTKNATGSSRADSTMYKKIKAITRTYVGVAMTVEKKIPVGVVLETKELTPFKGGIVRSWTKRCKLVVGKGISTSQGAI